MKHTLTAIFCLLLAPHVLAEPELKGNPNELTQYLSGIPRTVMVTGEAEVRVPADKAIVSLKVTTENKSLHEALRANQEARAKVGSFLQKQGIPPERVQAARFSSTPKFGMWGEKAKSYRVENVVKISVQDEKELQVAASAVDNWPEVQFVGAEFEHQDKAALKSRAVVEACENAQKRSKIFEEKLGLKLVPAKFSGGAVSQRMPAAVGNYVSSGRKPEITLSGGTTPLPAAEPDVAESVSSFGELIFNVEVTVEYQVQGR